MTTPTQQQQQQQQPQHHPLTINTNQGGQNYPPANYNQMFAPNYYHRRALSHLPIMYYDSMNLDVSTPPQHQRAGSTPNFVHYPPQYYPCTMNVYQHQPVYSNDFEYLPSPHPFVASNYPKPFPKSSDYHNQEKSGFSNQLHETKPVAFLEKILKQQLPPVKVKVECIERLNVLQFEEFMNDKFLGQLDNIMQTIFHQAQNWTSAEIQRLLQQDQNAGMETEAMSSKLLLHMHEQLPKRLRSTINLALHQIQAGIQPQQNLNLFFQLMRVLVVCGSDCFVVMTTESIRKHLMELFERPNTDAESSCCGDQTDLPQVLKHNMSCLNEARRMILETWEMAIMHMKGHCKDSQKMSKNDILIMAAVMAQYIIKPVPLHNL